MKTLIAYSTNHGCTTKIVNKLKSSIVGIVHIYNTKTDTPPELNDFDRVIIGGSIHAGRIQKSVKRYCTKHETELNNKELGLFICCMEEGDKARIQFTEAFPESLRTNAKASAFFGGEFDFNKISGFQRLIIKKVAKIENSTSKVDYEAIQKFSKKMDRVFNPFLFLA